MRPKPKTGIEKPVGIKAVVIVRPVIHTDFRFKRFVSLNWSVLNRRLSDEILARTTSGHLYCGMFGCFGFRQKSVIIFEIIPYVTRNLTAHARINSPANRKINKNLPENIITLGG
jgi:hypothetical protein